MGMPNSSMTFFSASDAAVMPCSPSANMSAICVVLSSLAANFTACCMIVAPMSSPSFHWDDGRVDCREEDGDEGYRHDAAYDSCMPADERGLRVDP